MNSTSITAVHANLPRMVSKGILKSMIGSLNATCIAYARGHIRFEPAPPVDRVPTIDDYNDSVAALWAAHEQQQAASGMGFNIQMQAGELAERLMGLRSFYASQLLQMQETIRDVPLAIAETLKFQMERQPSNDDARLEALADALQDEDITFEMLKAGQVQMVQDDAADLKANAGKVLTYLQRFETDDNDDHIEVEASFDMLPAHVQYKLMSAAIRAHDKAQKRAMQNLLRGNLDAAGDLKMLRANRNAMILWLTTFSKVKRTELDDYLERGGMLMEIEDRTIVQAAPVTKPEGSAGNYDATLSVLSGQKHGTIGTIEPALVEQINALVKKEPKATGPARRAPKPVAQ